jgi:hypothetical protein
MSDDVLELYPRRRRRTTRDTEPTTLTAVNEASVLRALARTERALEHLSTTVHDLCRISQVVAVILGFLMAWTALR